MVPFPLRGFPLWNCDLLFVNTAGFKQRMLGIGILIKIKLGFVTPKGILAKRAYPQTISGLSGLHSLGCF